MKSFYHIIAVILLFPAWTGFAVAEEGESKADSTNSVNKSSTNAVPEKETDKSGAITLSNEYVDVQLFVPARTIEMREDGEDENIPAMDATAMGKDVSGGFSRNVQMDFRTWQQRELMAAEAAEPGETGESDDGFDLSEEALESDVSRWGWIAEGVRQLDVAERDAGQRRSTLRDFSRSRGTRGRAGDSPANRAYEFNRQLNKLDDLDYLDR